MLVPERHPKVFNFMWRPCEGERGIMAPYLCTVPAGCLYTLHIGKYYLGCRTFPQHMPGFPCSGPRNHRSVFSFLPGWCRASGPWRFYEDSIICSWDWAAGRCSWTFIQLLGSVSLLATSRANIWTRGGNPHRLFLQESLVRTVQKKHWVVLHWLLDWRPVSGSELWISLSDISYLMWTPLLQMIFENISLVSCMWWVKSCSRLPLSTSVHCPPTLTWPDMI